MPPEAPGRIGGIDLARGLAVLGMFGAHLGLDDRLGWSPSSWGAVVHGRPSILFATLAGVSIALLSGGHEPATGDALVRARVRVFVRAAWIFLVGGLLELLDTFVAVILGAYAVLFVLALPVLGWSPRRLLLLAAGLTVVAPPVIVSVGQIAVDHGDEEQPFVALTVTGFYPALLWWVFVLVGLAIGRQDLRRAGVRARLVGWGSAAAVAGYAGGWLSAREFGGGTAAAEGLDAGIAADRGTWELSWFSGAWPHSGTPFEVVGSTGVAVAVLGVCLVLADLLPVLTAPFEAVGALALTVYSAHIVLIWALWTVDPLREGGSATWLLFAGTALVGAAAWRAARGRGPLERLLTWSSRAAAGERSPARADHRAGARR